MDLKFRCQLLKLGSTNNAYVMYAFRASNYIHVSKLESTSACREKRGNVLPPSWQKENLMREIESFSFRIVIVTVSPFSAD